jgi:ABC-type branched-subunit amino acid transport system substrate-binding protein
LAWPTDAQDSVPFHQLRRQSSAFAAPDQDSRSVRQVDAVLIGYFGPTDQNDAQGHRMWRAAQAAVEQANGQGGLDGVPFRLVPAWSTNPWGTGVAQLARLAYQEHVWAIVGGIDGPSTHLAEQVVAKARLPLLSPVSTDKSASLANVPWLFSLAPGDHLSAPVLANRIEQCVGRQAWILISSDDHDARQFARDLKAALSAHKLSPAMQFVYRQSAPELAAVVRETVQRKPAAVVVLGDSEASAQCVRLLRGQGYAGSLFGGPRMGRARFLQSAGPAAEGVIFPLLTASPNPPPGPLSHAADPPAVLACGQWDYADQLTYDAVQLTIDAIRRAGLNREQIRTAIHDVAPWTGLAGTVTWDPLGSNTREVHLATVSGGRLQRLADVPQQ